MTSPWIAGARPNTLPAAVAPVLAGLAATRLHTDRWVVLACTAVIALALQVGVNYANDYSDGIRGTDDDRVGPLRLVASGSASPAAVKRAAFLSFGVAAAAGLLAVVLTGHWWLVAVGIACILAAWFYTGGSRPYGYAGLGELMVFIFFGLVATVGTTYLLIDRAPLESWVAACSVGVLASALLVVNNLRDLHKDKLVGKHTLPTRLGDAGTRWFYVALVVISAVGVVIFAALTTWWALLALLGPVLLIRPVGAMLGGASGKELIPMLRATSMGELLLAVLLLLGVGIGRLG